MFFTVLLLGTLTYFLGVFLWRRHRQMCIFKEMGIPGPKPNLLLGNLLTFRKKLISQAYKEWAEQYGETFGYFEGPTPVLVTSNADLLNQVFIKQFNNFHARKLWPVQADPDQDEEIHLFFARGQRWKRLRSAVNAGFTAAKLRKMQNQMSLCADKLLEVVDRTIEEKEDCRVDFSKLFRQLTFDIIGRSALGIDSDALRDPQCGFIKHCEDVIEDTTKQPVLYTLGFLFPSLSKLWIAIYKFMHHIQFNPVYWIEDRLRAWVKARKESEERTDDLLQQMLDARYPVNRHQDLDTTHQPHIDENGNISKGPLLRSLTESEVIAHSLLFLLAGYETTSSTLSYIFYELALHPHVQDRMRQEVVDVLEDDEEPTYDNIRNLTYMDMVISETLRKYPLASIVVARQCQDACQIEGINIPSGMLVQANLWTLHQDPKHWGPDSDSFDPLRFTLEKKAERHSMAFMPFGAGPRMCIGQRFSIVQMKITMAKLLRRYKIERTSDLQVPLKLKEGAAILPIHNIALRTERIS
ncbi:putative cytochrome P450 CYP13A4 [Pomacea canaliculata]|uniref:putative cytochrome P450 CYP13A4 n=1 Tax=Pomacea canaliculata TaxID=400727 RepID=UPI000D73D86A|nr:putative cytochrome P450 CYP13A4 [Pomacea canaliculata]